MFHWPRGPSIFKPDWSTGQMPESSSGIRGGHVKVESESERDSLCEERKKNKQEKKKKRGDEVEETDLNVLPRLSCSALLASFSARVLSKIRRLIMMDQRTFISKTKNKRRKCVFVFVTEAERTLRL